MKVYLIGLILALCSSVLAQEKIDKRSYQMNRKAYLLKYAQEDSVLAEAINAYFDKRDAAINKTIAFPMGVAVTAASVIVHVASPDKQVKSLANYGIIFGGLTTLVGIPMGIKGIKMLKKYTRKDLYLAILQIKSGQMSSQDFYNKIHDND